MKKFFNIKVKKSYTEDSEKEYTSEIIFCKKNWKMFKNICLSLLVTWPL